MRRYWVSGCSTVGQAGDVDPATGKIKSQSFIKTEATIVKAESISLKKYRPLVLTLGNNFFKEQSIKFGYFDQVVDRKDMEKLLIQVGKSDIVTDVTNMLSWKRIADNYKPFLVLTPEIRKDGRKSYAQLKVIQADTATEVFIAEVKLDYMWKGVNDDSVFYPLYNAFMTWVRKNP